MITPSGAVSTLAGSAGNYGSADGTGNGAQFYQPQGVTVDSAGNLYVADTGIFADSPAVNPMHTCMALADYIAQGIAARF